jgi:hypothetical protein
MSLPITGGVGTGNGVTNNKMTELCPSEEKDAVKEIIDSFNAGSKRLEIHLQKTSKLEIYASPQIPSGIIHWRLAFPEGVR